MHLHAAETALHCAAKNGHAQVVCALLTGGADFDKVDNLGYTERGQVLNCSSFEVARRVSQALEADKLIVYHGEQIAKLNLPAWIGLSDDSSYIWSQGESFESGRFTFSALLRSPLPKPPPILGRRPGKSILSSSFGAD